MQNYEPQFFQDIVCNIWDTQKHKKIWTSIDKAADASVQCMCSAVVDSLKAGSRSFLLNIQIFDQLNHSTIATFFNDSLTFLWPEGVWYDNVVLFLSDAASYIVKATTGLKVLCPKLVHLICLAHGLHHVTEIVRSQYKDMNLLVSSVKKIFVKAPIRI